MLPNIPWIFNLLQLIPHHLGVNHSISFLLCWRSIYISRNLFYQNLSTLSQLYIPDLFLARWVVPHTDLIDQHIMIHRSTKPIYAWLMIIQEIKFCKVLEITNSVTVYRDSEDILLASSLDGKERLTVSLNAICIIEETNQSPSALSIILTFLILGQGH